VPTGGDYCTPTDKKSARRAASALIEDYEKRFPEAIRCLEDGLEDSLSFYDFPGGRQEKDLLDQRPGAAENGDPPAEPGGRRVPLGRILCPSHDLLSCGICRELGERTELYPGG
jgi:hypothetical protein